MFAKKSISRIFPFLFIFLFILSVAPPQATRAAGVRYTKPVASGSGDCSSWANACILQDALTGAVSGEEIWAAAGTYKPTTDPDNRNATFQLIDGVALYGGFAGTETERTQRNPATNLTILSGDIDSNDTQTPIITDITSVSGNTTNSYHVVTGANNASLDGFTVTAGNSNGGGCPGLNCGAGMYNNSISPTVTNTTFSGNSAEYGGGGMFNWYSNPTVTNVTFSHNFGGLNGGGMENNYSNPTLTNVTFDGNTASTYAGGMANTFCSPILTNVTFSGNSATSYGGGMTNWGSNPTIRNTIFWGNTAPTGAQIHDESGGAASMSDSVVQGGYTGTNIITTDPLLGTLGNYGGSTQTIPLLAGSSAIDTGNDSICPVADQRGMARLQGAHCDIGAYEYASIYYVKPVASGTGDCQSWTNACILQTALTGAVNNGEIWAAAGMYKPTAGTDRSATFQLKNGVALYGGFAGTETARNQRDPAANLTILSGDIDSNDSQTPVITDITSVTGNATNSYHVVTGATGATLDGFTISAGNANTTGNACPGTGCGGGMYNYNSSSPTLTNIIFSGNSTYTAGGGMINHSSSSPILTNVTFSSNSQTYGWGSNGGGGMYNVFSSSPTLTNVTFSQNSAYWGGGLFSQHSSSPTLTNVTFSQNSASIGGGMYTLGSNPVILNVTFDGNTAVSQGGALNIDSGSAQIRNTIFWGNTAPTGAQIWDDGSTPSVSDSVVQGGYPAGTNIITTDPLLGTLGNYGGFTQTIPLTTGSSAINATSSNCPATDQRGVPRSNPTCDIGAYEVFSLLAVPGGKTSGLCESWANACELRYALSSVASGEEIWVAAGTYKPTAGTDRGATFLLVNNIAVYGGFAGTETALSQRNPSVRVTILSGEIGAVGNIDNSYHVVTGATGATLDGFTITAGNANGMDCPGTSCGGGMLNDSSSPTLNNITFSGNSATVAGGGMANSSSSPTVTNVTFSGNSAAENGGGMVNYSSSPTLANVSFSGNSSTLGGGMSNFSSSPSLTDVSFSGNTAAHSGGMYNDASGNPTLLNVTFSGNQATTGDGGGLGNDGGNPTLTNVTFSGNSGHYGGGIFNQSGSPTLTNVTFSGNTAQYGGGLYTIYASSPTIRNTIFWGNTASGGEPQIWNSGSSLTVSDSVVQDGCPTGSTCTNIISADPKLGVIGNYGGLTQTIPILTGSSAIDTGSDSICPATDQRGITRPQGAHCDIGAYEYVDTTAPVVLSSVRLGANPTSAPSVNFTVTFSESVTGVDKDDFSLTITGVSGASVTGVSGTGSIFTVTVNTGTGNGSIRLDVPASGVTITDLAGNPLASLPYTSGQTYSVNKNYSVYLPFIRR